MSLEGKLSDLSLADIFQILSLSKRSGVLTIMRKEGTARLVFSQGNIVYASADNKSRLGYTLVNKAIITTDELETALKIQSRTGGEKPLGTILIETKAISRELLEADIIKHICVVVSELLTWTTGSFHFEIGELVTPDFIVPLQNGVSTDFILLEAARISDEEEQQRSKRKDLDSQNATAKSSQGATGEDILGKGLTDPEDANGNSTTYKADDMQILTSMIAEISGPATKSEITLMVLRFASELMNRAILFMVRKSDVIGLGQFGVTFDDGTESDAKIRSISVSLAKESIFQHIVEKMMVYKGEIEKNDTNSYIVEQLGGKWPKEVFVAPIITDNKPVAILYADNLPDNSPIGKTSGLEAFINVAGVSLGKTLLERKLKEKEK